VAFTFTAKYSILTVQTAGARVLGELCIERLALCRCSARHDY
jgi:hypothetical protein